MAGLHGVVDHPHQFLAERGQVYLITQAGAEGGQGAGGVVLAAVEAAADDGLDATAQKTARYLILDHGSTFIPGFDAVFRSEGVEIVRTPSRAPTANAVAERWIG